MYSGATKSSTHVITYIRASWDRYVQFRRKGTKIEANAMIEPSLNVSEMQEGSAELVRAGIFQLTRVCMSPNLWELES